MDVGTIAKGVSVYGLPVLFAVILHEVAHGWVAEKFGDSTARRAGRITLNPISHIDPIGTVLMPIIQIAAFGRFFIGWAKPVPVNFAGLRNPKRDMIWVAMAGPGTNFLFALFSAVIIRIIILFTPSIFEILTVNATSPDSVKNFGVEVMILIPIFLMLCAAILVNTVLMVINLIPVPPLDGGRIMVGLLPDRAAYSYSKIERFGFFIVLFLLFGLPSARYLFSWIISVCVALFSIGAGINVISVLGLD